MKYLKIACLFFSLLLFVNCKTYKTSFLENGDLLFVSAVQMGLSGAIDNVTQTAKNTSYDHIGILNIKGNRFYVLHASPKGGSQRQRLHSFLKNQTKKERIVDVYRLYNKDQQLIYKAIAKAESLIGKPYNFDYILNVDSYYCSDFVERAFRESQVFQLEPMTFVDPKTGKTHVFWENYYKNKNLKVPEGELGCNPNGLAASNKIYSIGRFK